ncbi:hypothetical protein [Paenibacillus sp. FSL R5-0470]|uniref:WD40/YVTN/BNR-like repeat-containing protein n=1 Tax=Paenibacillus sp. FSL R5-0470 TaxID=2921641 RepID=UPI0030D98340
MNKRKNLIFRIIIIILCIGFISGFDIQKNNKIEEIYTDIYHPFIDDDYSLWGISGSILKWSNDYGDSWSEVFDFATIGGGKARPPIYGAVYVSRKGYVFVGLEDGNVYRSETKRELNKKSELNFVISLKLTDSRTTATPWSIAEDSQGILYIGQYGIIEKNAAYLYKSVDDGQTWKKNSYFTQFVDRHIHQVSVDPYTDTLYVTAGDGPKMTFKSIDKGETFKTILGPDPFGGDTGLTYFRDGRIWGTDFFFNGNKNPDSKGYINQIRKSSGDDDIFETKLILDKNPDNAPFYDLHAVKGTLIAYALAHDEWDDDLTKRSSIWITTDKGESWRRILETDIGSKAPVFMGIAHGRNSLIPEGFPYLIITNHFTRDKLYPREGEMHLTRIKIKDTIFRKSS